MRSHPRPPWWKRRATKVTGAVLVPALAVLVGAWLLWIAGPPQPSPPVAVGTTQPGHDSHSSDSVKSIDDLPVKIYSAD